MLVASFSVKKKLCSIAVRLQNVRREKISVRFTYKYSKSVAPSKRTIYRRVKNCRITYSKLEKIKHENFTLCVPYIILQCVNDQRDAQFL